MFQFRNMVSIKMKSLGFLLLLVLLSLSYPAIVANRITLSWVLGMFCHAKQRGTEKEIKRFIAH